MGGGRFRATMNRFKFLDGNWSLRARFMIAPFLGLILLGLLVLAFEYEIHRQNELLTRIAGEDLEEYELHSRLFVDLAEQHLALYQLLSDTEFIDEETVYDQGKQRLDRIFEAVASLEQTVLRNADGTERMNPQRESLQNELLGHFEAYRDAATTAVEMATVDLSLAPEHLVRANDQFTAMNHALIEILDLGHRRVVTDIQNAVRRGDVSSTLIGLTGLGAAVLLLLVSFVLARLLSRSLTVQVNTLADLGIKAGAEFTIEETDEVGRLGHVVAVFKRSLVQLQDNERSLEVANRRLTVTLEELRKTRDELELRVQERTRELEDKNKALHAEVELRKKAEDHLRIYAEVIQSTGEAVVIMNLDGEIVEMNPAYEHSIGKAREELMGRHFFDHKRSDEAEALYEQLWRSLRAEGRWTGEIVDQRSNGELFPTWVLINTVQDDQGDATHYVCVSRDITELKRSEQQLKQLAFYDSLTQLPNRALFHDRLDIAIAGVERQAAILGVMYLDLDRFKYVNDTLGHAAGDRLLVEIAGRIKGCVRGSDTVARMGGDEFMLLLTYLDSEESAGLTAARLIEAVGKPVQIDNEKVYVGASIGISVYPRDGRDAETIQKNADLAMYEAKEGGRNQYRVFEPGMLAAGSRRLSLSVQIDSALNNEEFSLYYQPIVNSATGKVDTVEALIRWQQPDGSIMTADEFISHAEESGLIKKIDCWVVEQACRDAVKWRQADKLLNICVNLSAVSVQQGDMPGLIGAILQRTGMDPKQLSLEITETAVIANPYAAEKVLQEISTLGVSIAIDDFGVSHSSLSYLTRFPINCIKLDRMFIGRIGKDKTSEEIIRSLLELSRKLGLRVVAEGVEQEEQRSFLLDVGCEFMQGFHFMKPMSDTRLTEWFEREA